MIKVTNLQKVFKQYKKEPGLLGSLKSVVKRNYFEIKAVADISFEIGEGEVVGFVGRNGAGKTTTLKMLSGILHPTGGTIEVQGFNPTKRAPEFLKQISLVMGQKTQLWWDLPPMESFLLNKEIFGVSDTDFKKNLNELVELLDIAHVLNVPVRKLSLGQRMKCELAASLIHQPKVLFLDEPTIGLDVLAQKNIRDFIKKYNKQRKTTIILTSHYMDDVEELCQRIIIIDNGKLIYDGPLKDLVNNYIKDKYLKLIFNSPVKKTDLLKFGEVVEWVEEGIKATISVPREEHIKVAAKILGELPIDDLDISEASLENVVAEIFKEEKNNQIKIK